MEVRYAKIIDGGIRTAPRTLTIGSQTVANPTEEQYRAAGWLPYVPAEHPSISEDMTATPGYKEQGGKIMQFWTVRKDHPAMTEQEAIRHLFQSVPVTPQEAVRAAKAGFYPEFSEVVGQTLQTGYKLTYNGLLYITRQPVTVQAHQPPSVDTAAIYAAIEEEYEGTEYDPIPYRPGMALEQGKHYTDGGGLYRCTRDTGNPVYATLRELVGIYVEVKE